MRTTTSYQTSKRVSTLSAQSLVEFGLREIRGHHIHLKAKPITRNLETVTTNIYKIESFCLVESMESRNLLTRFELITGADARN